MIENEEWHRASDHLSIVAHSNAESFTVIFKALLKYVYGPEGQESKVFEGIAARYPEESLRLQETMPTFLLVYQVFLFAPSPEIFFERFNCEHFNLGTKA